MAGSPEKNCGFVCNGFVLLSGEDTRDGKRTFNVLCSNGKQGGCKGPDMEQLEELNQAAGRKVGADRRIPPLRFDRETGLPIVRRWVINKGIPFRDGYLSSIPRLILR